MTVDEAVQGLGGENGESGLVIVSVIVPSFRGAERLPNLLDSLSKQETSIAWELIVVLDGVVDDSEEVLDRYGDSLPLSVVRLRSNQGRPAALNAGFTASTGQVLVRCDDDLQPNPDFIERHALLHVTPGTAAIGICDNNLADSPYSRAWGRRANEHSKQSAYMCKPASMWTHWAANCSVDRELWRKVGGYDEEFRSYGWEDIDWGYRAWIAGATFVIDRALETPHHAAAVTTSVRVDRAFQSGRARARFEKKHGEVIPPDATSGGLKARIWCGLVLAGSHGRSEGTYARRGSMIDFLIRFSPPGLGGLMVSWGVESAGAAGLKVGRVRG